MSGWGLGFFSEFVEVKQKFDIDEASYRIHISFYLVCNMIEILLGIDESPSGYSHACVDFKMVI